MDVEMVSRQLSVMADAFFEEQEAPTWLGTLAYATGLPLPVCSTLASALRRHYRSLFLDEWPSSESSWLDLVFQLVKQMDKHAVASLLRGKGFGLMKPLWNPESSDETWASACDTALSVATKYMTGGTVDEVVRLADPQLPESCSRGYNRGPMPRFTILNSDFFEPLSRLCGGLSALLDTMSEDAAKAAWFGSLVSLTTETRATLATLPLLVRNGLPDRDALAWFRHGPRLRVVATFLASRYPIPRGITDEAGARMYIREKTRNLISARLAEGDMLGRAVQTVLSNR
jgi:hypothetical protein